MSIKILIPLYENDVAPRFDLATEVLIATGGGHPAAKENKIVVLPRAAADQLCHLAITEKVAVVICGGIEDTYYRYLIWKGIHVIEAVIGPYETALRRYFDSKLVSGTILPQ